MKKGLEAPSNIMVLVMFIVILAILILLVLFFGDKLLGSEAFNKTTNFTQNIGWG